MEKVLSAEMRRKRKFMVALPILVLPFLTAIFWLLGGGKGTGAEKATRDERKGFNTELPKAKFKQKDSEDKLSIYEEFSKSQSKEPVSDQELQKYFLHSDPSITGKDPNERLINQKLNEINSVLTKKEAPEANGTLGTSNRKVDTHNEVDRLENLMQSLNEDRAEDSEMDQLNSVLEKLLEIQDPSRVSKKEEVLHTHKSSATNYVRAYSSDSLTSLRDKANTIRAVVHEDHEVTPGSVVKLRLVDSIQAGNYMVPKNEFVYGRVTVGQERLRITIENIRFETTIIPVMLTAFDLDANEGLYTPEAIIGDLGRQGVDRAIQEVQLLTANPSMSTTLAEAGLQAAKGLFRKKEKQVKIHLRAGYQVLLRNKN